MCQTTWTVLVKIKSWPLISLQVYAQEPLLYRGLGVCPLRIISLSELVRLRRDCYECYLFTSYAHYYIWFQRYIRKPKATVPPREGTVWILEWGLLFTKAVGTYFNCSYTLLHECTISCKRRCVCISLHDEVFAYRLLCILNLMAKICLWSHSTNSGSQNNSYFPLSACRGM